MKVLWLELGTVVNNAVSSHMNKLNQNKQSLI